jgi:hypothetical protein
LMISPRVADGQHRFGDAGTGALLYPG